MLNTIFWIFFNFGSLGLQISHVPCTQILSYFLRILVLGIWMVIFRKLSSYKLFDLKKGECETEQMSGCKLCGEYNLFFFIL